MEELRGWVGSVAVAAIVFAATACLSDDESVTMVPACGDDAGSVVCLDDVASVGSDAVVAVGAADGGDPGTMTSAKSSARR